MPTPNFAETLKIARDLQLEDAHNQAIAAAEASRIGSMQGFKDAVVRSRLDRVNHFEGTHPAVIWGDEVGDLTDDFIQFMQGRDYPGTAPYIDGQWQPPQHRFRWGKDVVTPGFWVPKREMAGYPLGVFRGKYDVEPWNRKDYPRFIHEHDRHHQHGSHPPRTFLADGAQPQDWMVFLGEDGLLRSHTRGIVEEKLHSRQTVPRALIRDIPPRYAVGGDEFDVTPASLLLRQNSAKNRGTDDPKHGLYGFGNQIVTPQAAIEDILRKTGV